MNKRGGVVKLILIIAILVILALAVYFTFFFYYTCKDKACFQAHQEKCAKTKFISDVQEMTWLYTIKGKSDGKCKIDVEIVQVKQGGVEFSALEGESMSCYTELKSTASPEADLNSCHGILKEELQNKIIQKLHAYILQNVGQIDEELERAI